MKVGFDFTLDDMVDVAERAAQRSGTVTRTRSQARLGVSVVSAVFVWLILPGEQWFRLLAAGAAAAIGWYTYPADLRKTHRRKLRKYFVEQFGGEGPFHCDVELTPEGLVTEQAGSRTVRAWSTVTAVLETPNSIDFVCRGSGSLVVRNRAFASREQYDEFLRTARNYANSVEKK